jgi:5-methylthioadenosine/S-adenosylhomocysteine deaminase
MDLPEGVGTTRQPQVLIKGGAVLSMDDAVGNFAVGDVLVDGNGHRGGRRQYRRSRCGCHRRGRPDRAAGFHRHPPPPVRDGATQPAGHGILINDGRPANATNYYETILQKFSMVYRPEDVYINELFGGIAQLDAGVTTVMDVSRSTIRRNIPTPPSKACAMPAAAASSATSKAGGTVPNTRRMPGASSEQYFSSDDQLLTMVMGGEIYLPGYEKAWKIGRELDLPIALHVVGTFGMQPTFDELGAAGMFGEDNIFIHMTGMSEDGWKYAADAGAHVSLAVPIEMHMRHGTPPIQQAIDLGMGISLSTDVECTMTADIFTQMRGLVTLQRMFVNEAALSGSEDYPELMQCLDAIRHGTMGGAEGAQARQQGPAR